jgi:hypothetical protein
LQDFRGEKKILDHKMCVLIFSTAFVWKISHSKKNWARYDKKCILVFMFLKYPSFLSVLMKLEFSRQVFEKLWNVIFKENPSSGRRMVPRGWTDGQTDMTKLIVTFLSFWSASKLVHYVHTLFVRFVFISGQTATDVLYNKLVFTAEMKIVYCAVRTGSLNPTV